MWYSCVCVWHLLLYINCVMCVWMCLWRLMETLPTCECCWYLLSLSSRSRIWWHFNPHRCDKEEENVVIILEMYTLALNIHTGKKQEEAKVHFIRQATTTTQTNRYGCKKTRQRCWLQLLLHSMKNVCTELFPIVVFHQSMKVPTRQSAGHTT